MSQLVLKKNILVVATKIAFHSIFEFLNLKFEKESIPKLRPYI